MRYSASLLIFAVSVSLIWPRATCQSTEARLSCLPFNMAMIPRVCAEFYRDNPPPAGGIIDESSNFPRIRMVLDGLLNNTPSTSEIDDLCVQLVRRYFCNYYWPVCDVATGSIYPVCTSSCNLLFNNEVCTDYLMRAIDMVMVEGIDVVPSPSSCTRTLLLPEFLPDTPEPLLADTCISIEGTPNNLIPLTCEDSRDIPVQCRGIVRNFYAPSSQLVDEDSALLQEIGRITELPGLAMCGELFNTLYCTLRYPACSTNLQKLRPICKSQCPMIVDQVEQCLDDLPDESSLIVSEMLPDDISCEDSETYYRFPSQYASDNPDECLIIRVPVALDTNSAGNSNSNTGIIIGVVASVSIVIVVLIAIILVVLLVRSKRRKSQHTVKMFTKPLDNQESDLNLRYVSTVRQSRNGGVEDNSSLNSSKSSLHTKINHFLQHVKEKFSEILLPVENVTKLEFIGKGTFGMVHKGKLVMPDGNVRVVAIKTIKSGSLDDMKDFVAETAVMKAFHHPNVLPLLGVCIDYDDEDVLKIVIPFMANGDLRTLLKNSRLSPYNTHEYPANMPEELLNRMCLHIAKGMEYLAERRFIHRDLAARNCMVDENFLIKVADFGFARDIYTSEYYRMDKHTTLPVKWMPLESLLDGYFNEKSDVWSYGVTCWEIFSLGRIPYPGVDNVDVVTFLKNGRRLEQPELCPSKMYEMIKSTWQEEPEKRPSFSDIVHFLYDQKITDTPVDEAEITSVGTNNDSAYLDLSNSQQ